MALVCDIKSEDLNKEGIVDNEDLEDGEIEDDGDEEQAEVPETATKPPEQLPEHKSESKTKDRDERDRSERSEKKRHEKKHLTEAEKSVMRLRKFEKLEREKRDKFRREQVVVGGPPLMEQEEDFATSLEKAIAKVLKKEKAAAPTSSDPEDSKDKFYEKERYRDREREDSREKEKEREKKSKKRKRKQKKNKQSKKNKSDSPKPDLEDYSINQQIDDYYEGCEPSPTSQKSEEESYDSEYSERSDGSQREKRRKKSKKKSSKIREREKMQQELRAKAGGKNVGVCLHYLQGLCVDDNCQYSHESVQPMKLELCKFYLQECCAKGDKCLYMHEEFPCKYYHTGIPCPYLEDCKFAHGGPLSDGIKQILFKHIETAPKELLGKFPRLSRDNASVMIQQAQKALQVKYGKKVDNEPFKSEATFNFEPPSDLSQSDNEQKFEFNKKDNKRNRPSRWEDPEPLDEKPFNNKSGFKDQDMRTSNGDIDMRTIQTTNIVNPNIFTTKPIIAPQNLIQPNLLLPNLIAHTRPNVLPGLLQANVLNSGVGLINPNILAQNNLQINQDINMSSVDIEKYKMEAGLVKKDFIEASKMDTDIRQFNNPLQDNRHLNRNVLSTDEDEDNLRIVLDEGDKTDKNMKTDFASLPKTQRDLFKGEEDKSGYYNDDGNIDWYSDDEDDNRLTIKDDYDEVKHENESKTVAKPMEVVEKLGDLSKFEISAEVSKLLTTIKQTSSLKKDDSPSRYSESNEGNKETTIEPKKDPRLTNDPRVARHSSTEEHHLSIYEQGSLADTIRDIDLRSTDQDYRGNLGDSDLRKASGRPDVDLRQMALPFKGMQNYTPATEIDASISSHPPIPWRVFIVEIPKPDYTGLKLSPNDPQASGDPRLRKIFRLSVDEKDSPMSPKASPKASSASVRVDPRRKKMESDPVKTQPDGSMSYAQQVSMLQASPFYQSLTSNQKLLLNQELANRNDKSGQSDPTMAAMLQSLGLITNVQHNAGGHMQALNILADVNNLGFRQIPNQGPVLPNPAMRGPNVTNIGQGLLGPAPPMQNIPPDFSMNFDPRSGGLLGNAPPQFVNYQNEGNNFNNFNEDFYPDMSGGPQYNGNNCGNNNRDNRGFRDRPRRGGRNSNNRNNRNFFRKNKHDKF